MAVLSGCGGGSSPSAYDDLMAAGWTSFQQGEFDDAVGSFGQARAKDPGRTEAYTGLGWARLKLDDQSTAGDEFEAGDAAGDVPADHYGGWAFLLGALGDFAGSNTRIQSALGLDATWEFTYDPAVNSMDLHLLAAQNHFLLGDFAASLLSVQAIEPSFVANVATAEGRIALGHEIEALGGEI
jgi:tetratricopeptide (TPR) repeat protein